MAIILSFPSDNFLTLLDHCFGHRIDTPPFPLGSLKPDNGSLRSEHLKKCLYHQLTIKVHVFEIPRAMFPVKRQHHSFYTIPVKRAHLFSHPRYCCSGFISGGLCFRLRWIKKSLFHLVQKYHSTGFHP